MPMPRRRELRRSAALAVLPIGAALALAFAGTGLAADAADARAQARTAAESWRAAFEARAVPQGPARYVVVLGEPSLADRLEQADGPVPVARQRAWTTGVEVAQRRLLAALREQGIVVEREEVFTRTLNGFSAVLDARALAVLDRSPAVRGVYPVRTVYPASISATALGAAAFGAGQGRRAEIALPGADGSGVTIALLDTGVDLAHPLLGGRVLRGFDVVDGDRDASAEARPGDPDQLETHGTRMAGLLVGAGGPQQLAGVVPGARLLPIRVLGWQPAADGEPQVIGRGDQLLAGIERAVDPDGDGAVDDAVRIAVAALVEPYAAFADSPESLAVDGALRLGTLIVAATGNDGPGAAGFGTVGAPASAPAALAVGSVDLRASVGQAAARLDVDGTPLLDATLPLLGPLPPAAAATLQATSLAGPSLLDPARPADAIVGGANLSEFFGPTGESRVSGRAVLLPADGTPIQVAARNAATAGATAVLVYGTLLPAGALDLEERVGIPVVSVPAIAGRTAAQAAAAGRVVSLTLAPAADVSNASVGRVAPFSSGGLGFGGLLRPDIVAPGVGLATADAGPADDGSARYATVTGSSAAAAVAAGAAALLAQARPDLDASGLRSALVGSAAPLVTQLGVEPASVAGAGLVDPAAAAAAEVLVDPPTLSLGRVTAGSWSGEASLRLRNVSSRALTVAFGVVPDGGELAIGFGVSPTSVELAPGETRDVRLVAVLGDAARLGDGWHSGVVVATPVGGPAARVPWATSLVEGEQPPLIDRAELVGDDLAAVGATAILRFRAGWVGRGDDGLAVQPVGLVDVELWTAKGVSLGVVARLRDVLPGRYAIGLTGRAPDGSLLGRGEYRIRFRVHPVDGGDGASTLVDGPSFRVGTGAPASADDQPPA
ncbi:MAG: S8 family serine peptidase [Thermoleophilia bacterium]